jgi:hypothetical protein
LLSHPAAHKKGRINRLSVLPLAAPSLIVP